MINIAKLEELPKFIGMRKDRCIHNDYYRYWRNGVHPWMIIKRTIKHFIGKSFNEAFSYYCKKVPKYHQHYFLEEFYRKKYWYQNKRYDCYYIDDEGLIQNAKIIEKKIVKLYSNDYKVAWRLIDKPPKWHWLKIGEITFDRPNYGFEHYYEQFIYSGKVIVFESKNDPRFQRYHQEKQQAWKRKSKEDKFARKNKAYSFLTKAEKERKEQREKDLINRDRHGFDDESFKGEFYHGQKRKKR